ncbi:MAG: putative inositol monophosphatase family protein [Candidatus Bathyarchaeota archaeon B23]|nr:MAG: putative inositol monophosphatase family protein [Candidatus Bathyarchaeota archaeon B23]
MASSRHLRLLVEAAERVRASILRAEGERRGLSLERRKRIVDEAAEEALEAYLRGSGASIRLVSEEGEATYRGGELLLIADPLDGTTNTASGIPFSAVALLLSETEHLSGALASVVLDVASGDVYKAERGLGAWRDGEPIRPRRPRPIPRAVISIDLSKSAPLERVRRLIAEARHLRQLGSAALSLCLVASGILDAHVDVRGVLRAVDSAAALHILREAGGVYRVNGVYLGDLRLTRGSRLSVIAASSDEMLRAIEKLVA